MKRTAQAVTLAMAIGLAGQASFAAPDEYDDSQSHPLRVLAYLTYPVGWLAEWTIFRPFHLLVSGTRAQEAFFGHTPHPTVLAEPQTLHDYGVAKKVPVQTVRVAPPAPLPVPMPEHVKIVEVPVEKRLGLGFDDALQCLVIRHLGRSQLAHRQYSTHRQCRKSQSHSEPP